MQMGVILLWQGTGQGLGLGVPAGPETLRRDRVKRNTRAGGFCRTGGRGRLGIGARDSCRTGDLWEGRGQARLVVSAG